MHCDQVRALIDSYVSEELTPDQRELLEMHLRDCQNCQQELANLCKLLAALRSVTTPPIPQGFVDRVMSRAKEGEAVVARSRRVSSGASAWKRIEVSAGIAVSLAAGLVVGVFLGNEAWRADRQQGIASATQAPDVVASDVEYLVDPGGDSLARAYLGLTTISDR